MGQTKHEYQPYKTVWATVKPIKSTEVNFIGKLKPDVTHRLYIRYREDITADMRIQIGNGCLVLPVRRLISMTLMSFWRSRQRRCLSARSIDVEVIKEGDLAQSMEKAAKQFPASTETILKKEARNIAKDLGDRVTVEAKGHHYYEGDEEDQPKRLKDSFRQGKSNQIRNKIYCCSHIQRAALSSLRGRS